MLDYISSFEEIFEGGPRDTTSTHFDYHRNDPSNPRDYQDELKSWNPKKHKHYDIFYPFLMTKYVNDPTGNESEYPWLLDDKDGKKRHNPELDRNGFETFALFCLRKQIQDTVKFSGKMVSELEKWYEENFEDLWIPKAQWARSKARFARTLPMIKTTLEALYVADSAAREGRNTEDRLYFKTILDAKQFKIWEASTNAEYHLSWGKLIAKLYAVMK